MISDKKIAKPFVKWVGGKTQLLTELESRISSNVLVGGSVDVYLEPFVGGGAFFFYLASKYQMKKSVLFDINADLVLTYNVIKYNVNGLINNLSLLAEKYLSLADEQRELLFYEIRRQNNINRINFNYSDKISLEHIQRASEFIFLNKTCFNGLYRQNSKGEFNVPFGRYKSPKICDMDNLILCSSSLQNTHIINADFEASESYIGIDTNKVSYLVYLDPPYKPIKETSSFTKYHKNDFTDNEQIRLANYFIRLSKKRVSIILSNSDPKDVNVDNNFFDDLYSNFKIDRVNAKRFISAKGSSRGRVSELIISSFY